MTSKEALEILYRNCPMTVVRESDEIKLYSEYLVELITQDLERLEKLENENQELKELYAFERQLNRNQYGIIKEFYEKNLKLEDENEKLKKVIEILKNKVVSIPLLFDTKNVEEFNAIAPPQNQLTQEEYDLLKEFLWLK